MLIYVLQKWTDWLCFFSLLLFILGGGGGFWNYLFILDYFPYALPHSWFCWKFDIHFRLGLWTSVTLSVPPFLQTVGPAMKLSLILNLVAVHILSLSKNVICGIDPHTYKLSICCQLSHTHWISKPTLSLGLKLMFSIAFHFIGQFGLMLVILVCQLEWWSCHSWSTCVELSNIYLGTLKIFLFISSWFALDILSVFCSQSVGMPHPSNYGWCISFLRVFW